MNLIIKPFISKKTSFFQEKHRCYTFLIRLNSNKIELRKELNEMFGVTIKCIRTMIYYKKDKSKYTKKGLLRGKTNKVKKAIIQLQDNQYIDFLYKQDNSKNLNN
ncbi:50S ribosomal protein L23 [Blattabacterium cuenoti]|uniref:50S ribosomal protein L23 n=1 Tax=Blattabacterium cuenoti TaxID=1653831 RepID=UPI00163D0907|nr:50S ribosomal protein L23 [Blattabacterium cuenoti]